MCQQFFVLLSYLVIAAFLNMVCPPEVGREERKKMSSSFNMDRKKKFNGYTSRSSVCLLTCSIPASRRDDEDQSRIK
jgi:hypothetical protein